jgi:hypothetical protein
VDVRVMGGGAGGAVVVGLSRVLMSWTRMHVWLQFVVPSPRGRKEFIRPQAYQCSKHYKIDRTIVF